MNIEEFFAQMEAVINATTPTLEIYTELLSRYRTAKWAPAMVLHGSLSLLKMMLADDDIESATSYYLWRSIYIGRSPSRVYWRPLISTYPPHYFK